MYYWSHLVDQLFLTIVVFAGTLAVVCHFITRRKYRRLRVKAMIELWTTPLSWHHAPFILCKHFEQIKSEKVRPWCNQPSAEQLVCYIAFPSVYMQSQRG